MAYETEENNPSGKMRLDRTISTGNIVSWAMILAGFILGFAHLQATAKQALQNSDEAKSIAVGAMAKIQDLNIYYLEQGSEIKKDIAVIKATITQMDKKLDQNMRIGNPRE